MIASSVKIITSAMFFHVSIQVSHGDFMFILTYPIQLRFKSLFLQSTNKATSLCTHY